MRLNVLYTTALIIFASIGYLLWVPGFPPAIRSTFFPMFAIGTIFAVLGVIAEYRKKVRRRVTVFLLLFVAAMVVVVTLFLLDLTPLIIRVLITVLSTVYLCLILSIVLIHEPEEPEF